MKHANTGRNREAMEARRLLAVAEVRGGETQAAAARRHGVTPGAVSQWMKKYRSGGRKALKMTDATGRPGRLGAADLRKVERALLRGPKAHGYATDLWTLERVGRVVRQKTGASFHQSHVRRLLRGLGWSCRKPETRARERDEKAIAKWKKGTWPRLQKKGSK